MVPADAKLDEETMTKIYRSGHSRIPVHKVGRRWGCVGPAGVRQTAKFCSALAALLVLPFILHCSSPLTPCWSCASLMTPCALAVWHTPPEAMWVYVQARPAEGHGLDKC